MALSKTEEKKHDVIEIYEISDDSDSDDDTDDSDEEYSYDDDDEDWDKARRRTAEWADYLGRFLKGRGRR